MPTIYVECKHLLTELSGERFIYKCDGKTTVHDIVESMSKTKNYNFFRHFPLRLRHRTDPVILIKDASVKIKDLPIYTESYIYINITPHEYAQHKDEGYVPDSTS